MPPRAAAVRRRPAVLARERGQLTPGADPDNDQFERPNLPGLQGTPSARRSYTYGAAIEPPPSRPLERGDAVDLSGAVHGALQRHQQHRAAQLAEEKRRQSAADLFLEEAEREGNDDDDDEESRRAADLLAMPPPSFTPLQNPPAANSKNVGFASLIEQRDESDTDDARSFGMESDYYGDATIASTPATEPLQRASAVSQRRVAESQRLGASELPGLTPGRPRQSSNAENERSSSPGTSSQDTPGLRSSPRRPKQSKRKSESESQTNGAGSSSRLHAEASTTGRKQIVSNGLMQRAKNVANILGPNQRAPLRQRSGNSDHGKELGEETRTRPSLFAQAKNFAASPFSNRSYYASDHSEMDDAMQKEIQSNASDSEDEDTPLESQQSWSWTKPLSSLQLFRRDMPQVAAEEEDEVEEESLVSEPELTVAGDTINWWQLLNPYTYFQAFCWILGAAYSTVVDFFDKFFPHKLMESLYSSLEVLLYFVAAAVAFITLVSVVHAAIFGRIDGDFNMDRLLSIPEIEWPDFGQMADKAHGLIPEFSWPTWSRSSSLPDLSHLDADGLARLDEYLKQYQREFERIQKAGKLHDSSLKKLEAVVPKLVHIQLEDGKPVVAQEFWHALRDLIHRDGDFLTFERKNGVYEVASEAHWKAIASRVTKDPTFTRQINITVDSMETRVKEGAAGFWDSWVKNNDAKISEMLGSALDQIQNAGSQREFDKRLQRIVKQHIDESSKHASVVSREEFLRHLANEFATHRAEVRAELAELQPQLDNLVRQAAELAGKETPQGMSKAEIVTLVHGMVNKAVADINLEAMARGQIHSHWDTILRHQINYFGVGAGATIDKKHVSSSFDPPADSTFVKQKGIRGIQKPIPRAALEPWSDEGDCWCAARSVNHRGNPHGAILAVQLGHRVIPQHIVIEHIVAAATTDPDARPKEIEVYADIEGELRDVVRDFSATHFPDIYPLEEGQDGWNVSPAELPDRFVKIAQFVYEDVQPHDGVQVHRLSDELLNLGVATDHVIVRAVSNYGAKTHTCFYRVRLYGQRMEDGIPPA
ncbi:hypothetical protein PWT90_05933 [Aphanocladium album]|nr:hypothetical protein PWT90_05933 [Aphanocladium album]